MQKNVLIAGGNDSGTRLDIFAFSNLGGSYSRSYLQKLIDDGFFSLNGKPAKRSSKLKAGDEILYSIPEPEKVSLEAEDIPIEIIYEDSSIAVVNKPYGMTVHAGAGINSGTLVNALLYKINDLSGIGGEERPGIVHRLDKDTSGLLVIAKNDISHRNLSKAFAERKVYKEYAAIVHGIVYPQSSIIEEKIGRHPVQRKKMAVTSSGRDSITEYSTTQNFKTQAGDYTLLKIILHTGRTHQIRVHMAHKNNPIAGDPLYSKNTKQLNIPLMLSSVKLSFDHPETGKKMTFDIPYPDHMMKFLTKLGKIPPR
ncbi:MAG: RluA family pseudouridine synthase [Spirochaetes bacterium]|nr:RluA family pseudouridine synthase [Spirochaetota bacterium]